MKRGYRFEALTAFHQRGQDFHVHVHVRDG